MDNPAFQNTSEKDPKYHDVTEPNGTANGSVHYVEAPKENRFSVIVLNIQSSASQWYEEYGKYPKWIIIAVLVLLYFAYFIYAMTVEFGSEPSIRLLWMTALVVFMAIVIQLDLWRKLCETLEPCSKKISANAREALAWTIGLVLLVGLLAFVIVDAVVITKEPYNLVSLSGLALYVIVVFITSANPAMVNWRTVLWGILLQLILALLVLRWSVGYSIINWIADRFTTYINFVDAGVIFAFGDLYFRHWFAFKAMPVVVFISSTTAILYHFGIMQRCIQIIGWILQKALCTTAAESMSAAGNIFVGNTEAPLMILPMLKDMTKSELHCLMAGGFATIAGSAFGVYVLLGARPEHLVAASIMSAPAAMALAKLSYPETEESKTTVADVDALYKSPYRNVIEAASTGAIQAITLVANIVVNTIAFIALLEFVDNSLIWFGNRAGLYDPELSFGLICSYLLYPVALTMGVELEHCRKVAEILGIKIFVDLSLAYKMVGDYDKNRQDLEVFIAQNSTYSYQDSDIIVYHTDGSNSTLVNGILTERSAAITTFALCGFSGIGSLGIVLGALVGMIPHRKSDLSQLVVRALIVGNSASYMTACFAGLLFRSKE